MATALLVDDSTVIKRIMMNALLYFKVVYHRKRHDHQFWLFGRYEPINKI